MFAPCPSPYLYGVNGSCFPSIPRICPGCLKLLNFGPSSGSHFLSFTQTRIDQAGLQGRLMARASEPVFAPAVTMLLRALHDKDEREPASAARPTNARIPHPVAFRPQPPTTPAANC